MGDIPCFACRALTPPTSLFWSFFIFMLFREDINPCLEFPNESLSAEVKEAVLQNTICISPVKVSTSIQLLLEALLGSQFCFILELKSNISYLFTEASTYIIYIHLEFVI